MNGWRMHKIITSSKRKNISVDLVLIYETLNLNEDNNSGESTKMLCKNENFNLTIVGSAESRLNILSIGVYEE